MAERGAREQDVRDAGEELTVTGEMATVKIVIEFPEEERLGDYPTPSPSPHENMVVTQLRKRRDQLHKDIETEVHEILGPDAEVDELVLLPGSVEILAAVSAVAMVVSNVNSLMENFEKVSERIRRIVRLFLTRLPAMRGANVEYMVRGGWTPGPAMQRLQRSAEPRRLPRAQGIATVPGRSGVDPYIVALVGVYGLLIAMVVMLAILIAR